MGLGKAEGRNGISGAFVGLLFFLGLFPTGNATAADCGNPIGHLITVQGQVEISHPTSGGMTPATLNQPVCEKSRLITKAHSRATIKFHDHSDISLKENSSLNFEPVQPGQPWPLELLKGWLHFLSPRPTQIEINTPYVNAGVRGTEFVLFAEHGTGTTLWVIDGKVEAYNKHGSIDVTTGQSAFAAMGMAPKIQPVNINLKDAVAWALHYPPIIDLRADRYTKAAAASIPVSRALKLFRDHRISEAIDTLKQLPETQRSSATETLTAGLLLHVGLVDEASAHIEQARRADADYAPANALESIIILSQGDKEKARQLAESAVSADPNSAAARIALSYAHQALFKLEQARQDVKQALNIEQNNALAWSRLAELELSLGEYDKALASAGKATALDAELERTQTVLGFAKLIGLDADGAKQAFTDAIRLDSSASMPRLGLGLATIQQGDLEQGVREIETATALDPETAIYRSYLGKAYYELDRYDLAKKEFERAKQLDAKDPTPWLYDAYRATTENDPIAALESLQESIALNDQRAVYRSRLLIDSDEAVRATSLGRTFDELGFDRLASLEATKSLTKDPGNYSAHQLLSDANRNKPRHEIAMVSELLQAQLRAPRAQQPANAQTADARLSGISSDALEPAYNEYSRMFQQDGMNLTASALVGGKSTFSDELLFSWADGPASVAITQYHFETDGYRPKHYREQDYLSFLGNYRLTPRSNLQFEYRTLSDDHGELLWFFNPDDYFDDDITEDIQSWRIGAYHEISPGWEILASYQRESADASIRASDDSLFALIDESGRQGEIQLLGHIGAVNLILGGSTFDRERTDSESWFGEPLIYYPSELTHRKAYLYTTTTPLGSAAGPAITLGVSHEDYDDKDLIDQQQTLPKLGLVWDFPLNSGVTTTLRAAYFETLKRALLSNQTLEPTSIAGFNQFFDDPEASRAKVSALGVDAALPRLSLYGGVEVMKRDMDSFAFDFDTGGVAEFGSEEISAAAYLNWTPNKAWSIGIEYEYEEVDASPEAFGAERIVDVHTNRVSANIRYFHPSGLRLALSPAWVRQDGNFVSNFCDEFGCPVYQGDDSFWVMDASVTYKLPKRRGSLSLSIKNAFNESYRYQHSDPSETRFTPERTVFASGTLAF